jgi:two-component system cell cycle sensor histidine kinase/response regulator CckA
MIPNNHYRLLLVDDNLQSLKLLKAIYDSEGYQTVTANDGKEAMIILLNEKIDLIVTDVLMPNIDGYYLCFKVRTNEKLKDIPIIIYTATYTSQSEEKIALDMGADRFIRKPAALKVLLSAVREILDNPQHHELKVTREGDSFEMMHQYSSELVTKLEHRNIELEQTTNNLELTVNRFRQAEHIAHLGHWSLDFKSQAVYWSDETYRIFGIPKGSVAPSLDLLFQHTHPEDRERVQKLVVHSLQEFKPFVFSLRIVRDNGAVHNLFSSCEYEFDKLNTVERLYGIVLDITNLAEKEQKLEQANKELAAFIYSAYHDLRSPVVSILGLVNLASEEKDKDAALKYIDIIKEVANKQNKMLMNLVKIMSVRDKDLTTDGFQIASLLKDVLDSFKDNDGFKNIKCQVDDQYDHLITTDKELVYGILHELVDNATLYKSSVGPEINVSIKGDEEMNMILEVADNGIGMEAGVKEKVFNMFFRGNSISQGSGLGLYFVKNAVERLGGSINLISKENEGSSFQIKLPRHAKIDL